MILIFRILIGTLVTLQTLDPKVRAFATFWMIIFWSRRSCMSLVIQGLLVLLETFWISFLLIMTFSWRRSWWDQMHLILTIIPLLSSYMPRWEGRIMLGGKSIVIKRLIFMVCKTHYSLYHGIWQSLILALTKVWVSFKILCSVLWSTYTTDNTQTTF